MSKEKMTTQRVAVDGPTGEAFKEIAAEIEFAEMNHPVWPQDIFQQNSILQEEAGEISKAVNEHKWNGGSIEDIKTEVIQTAAMCVRFLKSIEKMERKN